MATLYEIADAILDAKEYIEYNTETPERIQDYAENGMGINVTTAQAEKILKAIKNWLAYDGPEGQHNRYVLLEKPLSNYGGSRPGAGRPPVGTEKRKSRAIRLTDEEFEKVNAYVKELKEGKKMGKLYPAIYKMENREWVLVQYCDNMRQAMETARAMGLPKGEYMVAQVEKQL